MEHNNKKVIDEALALYGETMRALDKSYAQDGIANIKGVTVIYHKADQYDEFVFEDYFVGYCKEYKREMGVRYYGRKQDKTTVAHECFHMMEYHTTGIYNSSVYGMLQKAHCTIGAKYNWSESRILQEACDCDLILYSMYRCMPREAKADIFSMYAVENVEYVPELCNMWHDRLKKIDPSVYGDAWGRTTHDSLSFWQAYRLKTCMVYIANVWVTYDCKSTPLEIFDNIDKKAYCLADTESAVKVYW